MQCAVVHCILEGRSNGTVYVRYNTVAGTRCGHQAWNNGEGECGMTSLCVLLVINPK
jgi:hypothetical protein